MTPAASAKATRALAREIRLVVFDFDGVFTDNRVLAFDDGTEAVWCWRGDGLGLRALRRQGVDVFVLSTEANPVVAVRCRKLAVPFAQGCADKREALIELVTGRGLALRQVAYVGNDINDLDCLRIVGLPIVVADAHPAVRKAARWRTRATGGRGAVREVCDWFQARLGTGQPRRLRRDA